MSYQSDHPYVPATCTPPDGIYTYWPGGINNHDIYLPPGWYPFDPDATETDRDVASVFTDSDPTFFPPLPPWVTAISDPDANGNYWYAGGQMPSGKYIPEGWWKPSEFYG